MGHCRWHSLLSEVSSPSTPTRPTKHRYLLYSWIINLQTVQDTIYDFYLYIFSHLVAFYFYAGISRKQFPSFFFSNINLKFYFLFGGSDKNLKLQVYLKNPENCQLGQTFTHFIKPAIFSPLQNPRMYSRKLDIGNLVPFEHTSLKIFLYY